MWCLFLSALYGNCAVKLFHNLIDKRQADACSRFFVIVSLDRIPRRCGRFSFDMPHPVSLMTICSRLPLRHKLILTFPKAGVNFMAF